MESVINLTIIDQILTILIKIAKGKSHVNSKITTLNLLKLLIFFFKNQLDPKVKIPNSKNYFKKVSRTIGDVTYSRIPLKVHCTFLYF